MAVGPIAFFSKSMLKLSSNASSGRFLMHLSAFVFQLAKSCRYSEFSHGDNYLSNHNTL